MAARPYWRGHIRISLVSFPVALISALRRSSQIKLHEIDRATGERIHHRNVNEEGKEVDREEIIKAYDTGDGIVELEPQEIADIKLPSSDMLALDTFVKIDDIPIALYERPYFVFRRISKTASFDCSRAIIRTGRKNIPTSQANLPGWAWTMPFWTARS